MIRQLAWLAVLGLLGAVGAADASADGVASPGGSSPDVPWPDVPWVVYCHDAARGVVQRTVAGACQGEVVSAAEAAAIEARHLAGRQRRVLQATPAPVAPGRTLSTIGTGFFVANGGAAEGGLVLTNNHVIAGCAVVAVETTSGRTMQAAVVATDQRNDLALLHTAAAAPATATFRGAEVPAAGSRLTIVGYPTRTLPPLQPQAISGTLLGPSNVTADGSHLQIGADIRAGSSGGPVFDERGHVVGVVVAKIDTVAVFRQTGELLEGIGFAIADGMVFSFLNRNGVAVQRKSSGPVLSRDQVFTAAKPFVARIACWR